MSMENIEKLEEHLKAYSQLPDPHYQAIANHLLRFVYEVDGDIDRMKGDYEEKLQNSYIDSIDSVARKDGSKTLVELGDYIYTVSVTKVHKSIHNQQPTP
jgi:hypothetical protein